MISCSKKINYKGPSLPGSLNIYEVTTRIYSDKNQLKKIKSDLKRIHSLFFNVIALQSPMSYDMSQNSFNPGSPFAINDFMKVDPAVGTETDLQELVDSCHALGIQIILEFNFNITGPNHSWRLHHPEFYKSNEKILNNRYNPEYIELNLNKAETSDIIFDVFEKTLSVYRFDGAVIYDLDKTPADFQKRVLSYIKSNPEKLFVQHSASEFQELGYHLNMIPLYELFRKTYNDSVSKEDYISYLESVKSHSSAHGTLDYFLNFHKGTDVQFYYNAYKYFSMFCAFAPGISWTMNGQEGPLFEPVNLFSTKTINWNYKYLENHYRSLNLQRINNPAFWIGEPENVPVVISDSKDVLAIERKKADKYCVLLFNLKNKTSSFKITKDYNECYDLFNKVPLKYKSGTDYSLGPFQAVMFSNVL